MRAAIRTAGAPVAMLPSAGLTCLPSHGADRHLDHHLGRVLEAGGARRHWAKHSGNDRGFACISSVAQGAAHGAQCGAGEGVDAESESGGQDVDLPQASLAEPSARDSRDKSAIMGLSSSSALPSGLAARIAAIRCSRGAQRVRRQSGTYRQVEATPSVQQQCPWPSQWRTPSPSSRA